MKKNKQTALIAVCVTVLAVIAITAISVIGIHIKETKLFNQQNFIAFSKTDYEAVTSNDFTRVSFDEIKSYDSVYKQYNEYQYYQNLNESEKIIYKSLEYALDNSYPVVFIDKRLLEDTEYSSFDIFNFLTLDSAIAEQNNVFQETEDFFVVFEGETKIKTPIISVVDGNVFNINIFDNEMLKNKEKAIEKAEEIVASLPQELDDLGKAKMLFTYLHENVEYIDYSDEQDYLYDTLIEGESNCDGFANAYSLLCKLAGIPCFEKMYSLPDENEDLPETTDVTATDTDDATEKTSEESDENSDEQEVDDAGHTWNVIKIDGVWYNVDATNSDFYFESDNGEKFFLFFGFSDKNSIYEHDYEEITPECNESLLVPDCTLKSFNDDNALSEMKKAWYENDGEYILVYCENPDGYDDTMQELANATRTSIYHENFNEYFTEFYFVAPQ